MCDGDRLLSGLNFADRTERAVCSDALRDAGRDSEADLLSGPLGDCAVVWHDRVVLPHQLSPEESIEAIIKAVEANSLISVPREIRSFLAVSGCPSSRDQYGRMPGVVWLNFQEESYPVAAHMVLRAVRANLQFHNLRLAIEWTQPALADHGAALIESYGSGWMALFPIDRDLSELVYATQFMGVPFQIRRLPAPAGHLATESYYVRLLCARPLEAPGMRYHLHLIPLAIANLCHSVQSARNFAENSISNYVRSVPKFDCYSPNLEAAFQV